MKKIRWSICIIAVVLAAAFFIGCGGKTTDNSPNYNITGTMMWTEASGDVVNNYWLQNVIMTLGDGSSATTDAVGHYAFTVHSNGTYTVTPTRTGFIFNPVSKTIEINAGNSADNNFIATYTGTYYSVSGTVTSTGAGLFGAVVTVGGSESGYGQGESLRADGSYSFSGLIPGTYTIRPSFSGRTFTPASITVVIDSADSAGNNFIAQ